MAVVRSKKSMKILQITNKVPVPPKDGGSIASLRLAEGLADQDHQVHILAMNTSKHFVTREEIQNFEKPNLAVTAVEIDTRIRPEKAMINLIFSRLPYNAVRFISPKFRSALKALISEFQPELIILENLYPAAYLDDIRRNSGAALAYRAHNVEHEIWHRMARNARGLKKHYISILARRIYEFEKDLVNKYDLLVPITARDADALEKLGNKKPCFILPAGYDSEIADCPPIKESEPVIAHLGALDWLPNQEGLLWFADEVWPLLRKQIPGIRFHLAGRNAPEWFNKKMNMPGVTIHGEIEDAGSFIQKYPIHIVPLFSGSGMRIKIVEGMAAGRVVVTTTIGTEGIDTQHKENILIADYPELFASEIIEALGDLDYCRKIGKNAFTFVNEKLNNKILIEGFLRFLENKI